MQRIETPNEERSIIDRASSADQAFLAMDTGRVPKPFAVILILDRPGNFQPFTTPLADLGPHSCSARGCDSLINLPPAFGRPIWVDDHDFRIDRHVRAVSCRGPGASRHCVMIMEPLPLRAPLWSIALITDLADGGAEARCPRKHRVPIIPYRARQRRSRPFRGQTQHRATPTRLDACAKAQ
jgi:Wax ester synthase-like Acyl-CoA acyltransferase domain